jgi:hypothetical protein
MAAYAARVMTGLDLDSLFREAVSAIDTRDAPGRWFRNLQR